MCFEDDLAELVRKGDLDEVRIRLSLPCCPSATKANAKSLIKEAEANRILNPLVKNARETEDFRSFCDAVEQVLDLAKSGSCPCRVKAGKAAIRLYSERLAIEHVARICGRRDVPRDVVRAARAELKTLRIDVSIAIDQPSRNQEPKARVVARV